MTLYQHSLTIALIVLFLISTWLHAKGGAEVYSIELQHQGQASVTTAGYLGTARFWFESLQNWQSEFLSIVAIVGLSIHLRQKGSPQSKPVDASHTETGES